MPPHTEEPRPNPRTWIEVVCLCVCVIFGFAWNDQCCFPMPPWGSSYIPIVIWHKRQKIHIQIQKQQDVSKVVKAKNVEAYVWTGCWPLRCYLDPHQVSPHMSPPRGSLCGCSSSLVQITKVEVAAWKEPHPDDQARVRVEPRLRSNGQPLPNLSTCLSIVKASFFFNERAPDCSIVVTWVFSRLQMHSPEFIGQLSQMRHGANFSSKIAPR